MSPIVVPADRGSAEQGPRWRAREHASRRQDGVTVVLGVWLVAALFTDGWAHHNVPELEGFFTPWHGALYTGLLANAAWIARLAWPNMSRGWRRALPTGYGWGAAGVGVFAAGGIADMAWHLAFGVEASIDALVSPSHLVLFAGGMLILTSPLRSRWALSDTASAVAQAALALPTALASFFLLYVSEFAVAAPTVGYRRVSEGAAGHDEAQLPAIAGLGGFLVTTAVIVVPLLLAWQRGRAPQGLVTVLVATLSWLSTSVVDFAPAAVAGAAGASVGAVAADMLTQRLDRRSWSVPGARLPALASVTAGLVWAAHVAVLALTPGLAWPPELWVGVVVLSTMEAATLGALARGGAPPPSVARAARRRRTPSARRVDLAAAG